jgi:rhodanese-related sulfurtransferase
VFGFRTAAVTQVGSQEAQRLQQQGALVVDVREPFEFATGHIPGAILVPLGELERRATGLDKSRTIVAVCASGNRSGAASQFLAQQGFDVVNLQGGMMGWTHAGLPTKRGS